MWLRKMKRIRFIVKLAIVAVLFLGSVLSAMLYLSRSGEEHAKETCSAIERGRKFDERESYGKRPILVSQDGLLFYSYLFLMHFDASAQCKVFVDANNVVTRTEVDVD